MSVLWMLVCGFVIFWAIEIRFNQLSKRVGILEHVIKDFGDHISKLRHELEDKGVIKGYNIDKSGRSRPNA